jgi:cell division GTPase FtsZ
LKAELEIKLLSEKIDHLLVHHNKKLLEIQELQTDYLEDLMKITQKK